ncbi:glycine-rich domain-containing protein-like domain-containing protein [Hirsutella rhossiliensis]|uniref:Glycine-rich domain-containing protein-like domain-containing protein n=1 Tax=Hirsutella rhossiliensis TaxID=111463 RepID=A0A9P8MYE4_9HYPO|nr:glycine-rich domain-containing protein-like domain-containing protein [Hirsutella rhossiliensis]KAH0962654.1 glycine-rich domain-containing protein-like domain-containing protein [Hirsutella rhossiliensis]
MAPSLFQAPASTAPAVHHGDAGSPRDSKLATSIPYVNSTTAHFHISLLRKFDEVYYCLEHDPSEDDHTENISLQAFLVLAESRYLQYLNLLSDFAAKVSQKDKFANIMPLPPWDVAMVFHAHCLNPFSFTADLTMLFERLLDAGIEFPLGRLHNLVKVGTNSDTESQCQWDNYHLEHGHNAALVPYQLSPDLPHALGDTIGWKTAGIYVKCPGCNSEMAFDLTSFSTMRLSGKPLTCTSCNISFDATRFPTNLVSASLRQRSFAAKMASDRFFGLDSPSNLEKATARYRQFMFVDVDMDDENAIVPTLDIDLIWHTHQLFPVEYRRWCIENLNRYVNHDDTVDEGDLATGFNHTVDIWLEKYGEKYEIVDFCKTIRRGRTDPPTTDYCEYGPLCWPGGTSSEHINASFSKTDPLLSCRFRCGKCSKADCHKPSNQEDQLLSCRFRCGKCSKADCHKPSNQEDQLLSCRFRCGKCSKADCHKPSNQEDQLVSERNQGQVKYCVVRPETILKNAIYLHGGEKHVTGPGHAKEVDNDGFR